MPKRATPIEDDDLEGLLKDAPDDLDDEDELVDWFATQLDIDDDAVEEMAKDAAEVAGTLAALAFLELFSAAWDALDGAQSDAEDASAGVEIGPELTEQLNDIASDMADDLTETLDTRWGDEDGSAISNIAEINAQSEYSDAKNTADAESGAEYAQYIAEGDACDVCQDCHGTILPIDDPWWGDHEPDANHPNCRCLKVPLSAEDADARGGVDRKAPDVEVSGWKDRWPPEVSDRPEVLAGIYESKLP